MTTDTAHTPQHAAEAPPQTRQDVRDRVYTREEQKIMDDAQIERATHDLKFFARSVTQGEWLEVTRGLDMTRPQIAEDTNLTLLAMAYVKEKREHGRAAWPLLLEMTDSQLLERHGFPPDALIGDEDE